MKALYERIKKARTELHLSQDYVAKFLGVNRTAVVEIESGKRKVSAEELGKFSELFQIPVDKNLIQALMPYLQFFYSILLIPLNCMSPFILPHFISKHKL